LSWLPNSLLTTFSFALQYGHFSCAVSGILIVTVHLGHCAYSCFSVFISASLFGFYCFAYDLVSAFGAYEMDAFGSSLFFGDVDGVYFCFASVAWVKVDCGFLHDIYYPLFCDSVVLPQRVKFTYFLYYAFLAVAFEHVMR
jgi:hypothetical protein